MRKRTPEVFELIERYLNNTLSNEEKLLFEESLKSDLELRDEVERHRELDLAMKDFEAVDFRKKLAQVVDDANVTSEQKVSRGFMLKIAAGLAVLIISSLVWWFSSTPTKNVLFDRYFEPYPPKDIIRGDASKDLDSVIEAYTREEYLKVIPKLNTLIEKYPDRLDLQLLLGSSYLKTNQGENAISAFKKSKELNGYNESSQWYLALSYLKSDMIDKTNKELSELILYDGIYAESARALSDDLNSKKTDDF